MTTPAGDPPNLGLLIKLMKLTTSSNDSEALLAIRKANEQLLKFGGDWERLLVGRVTVIGDPFLSTPTPPPAEARRRAPSSPARPTAPPPPPPPRPQPNPSFTYYAANRRKRRGSHAPKPSIDDVFDSI